MAKKKPITVSRNGEYTTYSSIVEACIELNISRTTIKKMLRGYTTADGYSAVLEKGELNDD